MKKSLEYLSIQSFILIHRSFLLLKKPTAGWGLCFGHLKHWIKIYFLYYLKQFLDLIYSIQALFGILYNGKWQIKLLEDVQRRSTKLLPVLKQLSYKETLHQLDLPTLVYLNARGNINKTRKLLTGKYDASFPGFLCLTRHQHNLRGHHLKLQCSYSKLDLRKYCFPHCTTSMQKDVLQDMISAKTVKQFENQLDLLWKEQPFTFDYLACYQLL